MKKTLALALLILPFLANAQTNDKNIFNKLFGNLGKTQAEISREMRDLARKKIDDGLSPKAACDEAMSEINIEKSRFESYNCEIDMGIAYREKIDRERSERRETEEEIEKTARQVETERRQQDELAKKAAMAITITEIRAGKKQAKSFEEAVAAYDAAEGLNLASAPKIRPDGRTYYLAGTIERSDNKTASFTALANNGLVNMMQRTLLGIGQGEPKYFYVRLPKSMEAKYYDTAKVGAGFDIVGKYSANLDYKTIIGAQKSMPVFDVLYFEFWTPEKLK